LLGCDASRTPEDGARWDEFAAKPAHCRQLNVDTLGHVFAFLSATFSRVCW